MKFSLFLILSVFSFSSFSATNDFLNQLEPLENPDFISTPEFDHQKLIAAFNEAQSSIQVGIFGISDPNVANALIAAKTRGVAVTVICDKYCVSNPKRLEIYNKLKNSGVEIYTASLGFTISHWKMFVIDQKKAFISTMNFITRFGQMRDVGLFLTNPSVVAEMVHVFKADVQNAKDQTGLTPALAQPNLVWSPVNSEDKLSALIDSAKSSIEIWIENLGNKKIHDSLKAAVARQVKVRVLSSLCGLGMPGQAAFENMKDLLDAKVTVKVMPFPASTDSPYIHAKTITADRSVVFLGSENFSANSLLKARELGLIFKNDAIEKQMNDLFEKDWVKAVDLPAAAPQTCQALSIAI